MKNKTRASISITIILMVFISFFIWIMSEKSSSYSEPSEALFAIDQEMVLIPGYKKDDEALYFFIKDKNYFGATHVKRGIFGWKTGVLTWGSSDFKVSLTT